MHAKFHVSRGKDLSLAGQDILHEFSLLTEPFLEALSGIIQLMERRIFLKVEGGRGWVSACCCMHQEIWYDHSHFPLLYGFYYDDAFSIPQGAPQV